MGPFDELFDFDRDGEVDREEFAAGLDYDDLLDMDVEERNEALEEEGLDPDDFSELFD